MSRKRKSSLEGGQDEMREGDWMCGECGAHNYNARMSCFKCTLTKQRSEVMTKGKAAGDWNCFQCSANNFAFREDCFKCHIPKFVSEGMRTEQHGIDWFCRMCDVKNFPEKLGCFKCKRPRRECDANPGPRSPPRGMMRGRSPPRSPPRMRRPSPGRPMSPPRRRMSPPRRGMSPPRRRMSPPRRGMSPPRRGMSPPRRGMSPPRRGMSPPRRRMSPPQRGMSPPRRRMSPPRREMPVPHGPGTDEEWHCGLCNTMNGLRRDHCYKCTTPRGPPVREPLLNHHPRGPAQSRLGQKDRSNNQKKSDGDWECPECHINNFHFRKECFKCKVAKPDVDEFADLSVTIDNPPAVLLNHSQSEGPARAGLLSTPTSKPDDYYEPESPPKRRRMNSPGLEPEHGGPSRQYGADWTCRFCSVDIFPKRTDCYKCGRTRAECGTGEPRQERSPPRLLPDPAPQGEGFTCECGTFNRCDEPACVWCGKPNNMRPPSLPRGAPLPNIDWDCRDCKINNYHYRTSCFKCKKARGQCEDLHSGGAGPQGGDVGFPRGGERGPPRGGERGPPRGGERGPPHGGERGRMGPPRGGEMERGRMGRGGGDRSPPRRTLLDRFDRPQNSPERPHRFDRPQNSRNSPERPHRFDRPQNSRNSPERPYRFDGPQNISLHDGPQNSRYSPDRPYRQDRPQNSRFSPDRMRGRSPPGMRHPPPKDPKYEPDWECRACEFNNFVKRKQCFKCKKDRSEVEVLYDKRGKPIGPNDWLCPDCGENNFSRRTTCYKCKTDKPEKRPAEDRPGILEGMEFTEGPQDLEA